MSDDLIWEDIDEYNSTESSWDSEDQYYLQDMVDRYNHQYHDTQYQESNYDSYDFYG